MSIVKISEISIAVKDLEQAVTDYEKMGFEVTQREEDTTPPIQARWAVVSQGDIALSLMESTEAGSPIDRFIQRRGEGLFSISLKVTDLDGEMEKLKAKGAEFVLDKPAKSEYLAERLNWTKPSALTHGVVFELQEIT